MSAEIKRERTDFLNALKCSIKTILGWQLLRNIGFSLTGFGCGLTFGFEEIDMQVLSMGEGIG